MKSFYFFSIFTIFLLLILNQSHSNELSILVDLTPGKDFTARSMELKGLAQMNPGNKLRVQNATLDLSTLSTGIPMRDDHMKNTYFEIKTPGNEKAVLKNAIGAGGKFKGNLVIRGVTKVIAGTYKLQKNNSEVAFTFETKMSDFNIKKASYMGVGAHDIVQVSGILPIGK